MKFDNIKKNIKSKRTLVIIGTLILVAAITLAWFAVTNGPLAETFKLSNFDGASDCYFTNGSRYEVSSYKDADGSIRLSLDQEQPNYIGNFRVDVKYKGAGSAYMRVKVACEFDSAGAATLATSKVPFIINNVYDEETAGNQAAWFDNRNADSCYYFADVIKGNKDSYTTLQLIKGINPTDEDGSFDIEDLKDNGINVKVAVGVDMVQINRYPQFWKIDNLPWES